MAGGTGRRRLSPAAGTERDVERLATHVASYDGDGPGERARPCIRLTGRTDGDRHPGPRERGNLIGYGVPRDGRLGRVGGLRPQPGDRAPVRRCSGACCSTTGPEPRVWAALAGSRLDAFAARTGSSRRESYFLRGTGDGAELPEPVLAGRDRGTDVRAGRDEASLAGGQRPGVRRTTRSRARGDPPTWRTGCRSRGSTRPGSSWPWTPDEAAHWPASTGRRCTTGPVRCTSSGGPRVPGHRPRQGAHHDRRALPARARPAHRRAVRRRLEHAGARAVRQARFRRGDGGRAVPPDVTPIFGRNPCQGASASWTACAIPSRASLAPSQTIPVMFRGSAVEHRRLAQVSLRHSPPRPASRRTRRLRLATGRNRR